MKKLLSPLNASFLFTCIIIALQFTPYAQNALSIGLTALCAFLVLFIHELGHVIGGRLAGYQFLFMTVGPVTIEKSPSFKIVPNPSWTSFGGLASCVPADIHIAKMVKQHKWFVAGGPLLTLAACFISLLFWMAADSEAAMMLTILHAAIFCATAIPLKGTFNSDGSVLLMLQKGGKEAEAYLAGLLLVKEMMSAHSPKEWNAGLIAEAQKTEASPEAMTTAYLLFYYYLMTEGYEEASLSIESFKNLPITKKTRFNMRFAAHIRQTDSFLSAKPDLPLIKELHKTLSKIDPISYKRSEALISFLQGDTQKARSLLEEVKQKCAEGRAQYGFLEAEQKLAEIVQNRMECGLERVTG
jgi:hypothetical protein